MRFSQLSPFWKRLFPWILGTVTVLVQLVGTVGSMLFARWWGSEIDFTQGFAWGMATVVALIFWPSLVAALNRQTWQKQLELQARLGAPVPPEEAQMPTFRVSTLEKWVRAWVFVVGGVALFVLVGAQSVVTWVYSFFDFFSSGGRSFWSLVQLVALIVITVPAFLVMWAMERRVNATEVGSIEREEAINRSSWWGSVIMGWGMSLFLGQVFAWVILANL
ncbi:MAG: hypothetical protein Q4D85_13765 [Corynebacterium sp.]|uniref:hypothetical protein n=1 Tax=Corynebacterium sp. TaxID=1720 RepID=UPI0026DD8168|nr:hypothetical protein [Corynebacterium sp.]MDO5099802.1 hypothetical protein [Corynebacterium sp.]